MIFFALIFLFSLCGILIILLLYLLQWSSNLFTFCLLLSFLFLNLVDFFQLYLQHFYWFKKISVSIFLISKVFLVLCKDLHRSYFIDAICYIFFFLWALPLVFLLLPTYSLFLLNFWFPYVHFCLLLYFYFKSIPQISAKLCLVNKSEAYFLSWL